MASTVDMYGYRKYLNEKGLNGEPTYGPSYMNTVAYPKTMISPKAETITGPGQPAAANMAGLYGPPAPGATMPPANTFNSPAAKMAAMYGPPAPTRTAGTSTPQKSVVQPTTQPTAQPDYLSMLNKAAATFSAPRQQFQYNAQADPQYQQALQAAQQGAATQQGNTLARLRSMGQGKSSYSEGVAQQIGQQAVADVNARTLPQLTAQAYQRYMDQQNLDRQNAIDMLTVGQGYNTLEQQGFQNEIAKSGVTGYYDDPETREVINRIIGYKKDAAQPGVTTEKMAGFKKSADQDRSLLKSRYGLDADKLGIGFENDYGEAVNNIANYRGLPTVQKQQMDISNQLASKNADLNQTQVMAQLTGLLPDGTPTNARQQQELTNLWQMADATGTIPAELAQFYGIPQGTQTLQAKQIAASIANSNAASARAAESEKRAAGNQQLANLYDIWDRTGKAPAGIPGVAEGTPLADKKGSAAAADMTQEKQGLVQAIRGGKMSPGQALQQIQEDAQLGFYTPEQANELKLFLQQVAGQQSAATKVTPEQQATQEEFMKTAPSDQEIETEAQQLGYPTLDYRSYYKDPNGKSAGLSFAQWQSLYGPKLK